MATTVTVDRPRASDAIGEALREAFSGEYGLPDDMMTCLRRLDKLEIRPSA